MKQAEKNLIYFGFMYDPEDGGDIFPRNLR
jgi:hypothetical protein